MQEASLSAMRDWLFEHRNELKRRVPGLRDLQPKAGLKSEPAFSNDELVAAWKEVAQCLKGMDAPPEVIGDLNETISMAEVEPSGEQGGRQSKPRLHLLAAHGEDSPNPVSPLFWRGCAFGALAALSSGIGAGGAALACLAVGLLAD